MTGTDISIGPGPYRFVDGTEAVRKGALDITRARTELGLRTALSYQEGIRSLYRGDAGTGAAEHAPRYLPQARA